MNLVSGRRPALAAAVALASSGPAHALGRSPYDPAVMPQKIVVNTTGAPPRRSYLGPRSASGGSESRSHIHEIGRMARTGRFRKDVPWWFAREPRDGSRA